MKIIEGINGLPGRGARAVVASGTFDGVHRGHQALLRRVVEAARERDGTATVVTFDPSPGECFSQNGADGRLTPREEQLDLLAALAIRLCVVVPFTPDLAAWPWDAFARVVYQEGLGAVLVVVGPDHTFGAGAAGTPERLAAFGRDAGFAVECVPRVCVNGVEVRSTAIRRALREGDVAAAASMLGRPYALSGEVVPGRGEGRRLGFPTANVACPSDKMLPAEGVYAAVARLPDPVPAALHVGPRPTYGLQHSTVEAHLVGFDGDLTGVRLSLDLIQRLRPQAKFASAEQLARQIASDVERARQIATEALSAEEVEASR